MTAAATVGCTGLVGSHILSTLLTHSPFAHVSAFTRKDLSPRDPNSRLRPIKDADSSNWPSEFSSVSPVPAVLLSALGTTRAAAGGFEKQRKIDVDLNLSLAKAAKEAGVRYYVLISSGGVSSKSVFPYSKMKGELEEAASDIGFEKTVLLKPGLLMGARSESRPPEYIVQVIASFLGKISGGRLSNFWAIEADVVGRAAVLAAEKCLDGTAPEGKVWVVSHAEIRRLGETEWGKKGM